MPRRGQIFTPKAIEIIRGLASQGKSASEIADAIGSTPASVRVRCCQLKIKLSRRGRRCSPQIQLSHILEPNLVVVSMRPSTFAALKRKATDMQKSAVELAAMLLDAIVSGDLYGTVLDGGE
jgi:hypothetical protein